MTWFAGVASTSWAPPLQPGVAYAENGNIRARRSAVKQIQVTRIRRTPAPVEIDTRTPGGRVLPF